MTGIKTSSILFNPNLAPLPYQKGTVFYDSGSNSLAYYNDATGMTLNIGQESIFRVINSGAPLISNGAVVYISGAFGNMAAVNLAKADSGHNNISIGVATVDIPSGSGGYVTYFGVVHGINTAIGGLVAGQPAYLSPTVYGGLTGTAPIAPSYAIKIGIVTRVDPVLGELFVNSNIGSSVSGANDVFVNSPLEGQILTYTFTGNRWENRTNIDVSGYIKARNFTMDVTGVPTPASIGSAPALLTFNLLGSSLSTVTITGSTVISGTNYSAGRSFTARIFSSGTVPLSWAPWRWVGQTGQIGPTGLQSNRVGLLSIQCFDTTDTGVVAAFAVEGG